MEEHKQMEQLEQWRLHDQVLQMVVKKGSNEQPAHHFSYRTMQRIVAQEQRMARRKKLAEVVVLTAVAMIAMGVVIAFSWSYFLDIGLLFSRGMSVHDAPANPSLLVGMVVCCSFFGALNLFLRKQFRQ